MTSFYNLFSKSMLTLQIVQHVVAPQGQHIRRASHSHNPTTRNKLEDHIGLLLKLIAMLCDGQHRALQVHVHDHLESNKLLSYLASTLFYNLDNWIYTCVDIYTNHMT